LVNYSFLRELEPFEYAQRPENEGREDGHPQRGKTATKGEQGE
jgi:hypothetical protein